MNERRLELVGGVLLVLCVAALLVGTLAVLRPFLPALVWAAIIVVATWPIMLRVQRYWGGRRALAVATMTTALFAVVVAPVSMLLGTLVTRLPELRELGDRILAGPWPGPPDWVAGLPFGEQLRAQWQQAITETPAHWTELSRPYIGKAAIWVTQHIGTIGGLTLEFFITLVLVVMLYLHGEAVAQMTRRVARRIGGTRGEDSILLAAQVMRAIAAGVILTALVEAILSGLGLWVVGTPAAAILTSVMFMLCVMQIGPMPVLVPVVIWLLSQGEVGWGVALGVWAVAMSVGEGLLRPWLIQRGAQLSFFLILAGVIGGLLAFGVTGIFIGPILLAVVKRLLDRWVAESP